MPWKVNHRVSDLRFEFIREAERQRRPFSQLCEAYGISRVTGYKWLQRHQAQGMAGLEDQSRRPHTHPFAVAPETLALLLQTKAAYPAWGARTILDVLRREHPLLPLPSATTVHHYFQRDGWVKPRKKRQRAPAHHSPLAGYVGPNAVWCADFKGPMQSQGGRVEPLTVSDGYSRFLLAARCLRKKDGLHARPVFDVLFREYGLPDAIRTDNGPPFSTVGLAGLSVLSLWWIRLGIRPELTRPATPSDNGRHERMHGTMERECAEDVRASARPQEVLDAFHHRYNHVRPHQAMAGKTPADVYVASPTPFPRRLRDPVYPDDHFVERVSRQGRLFFQGHSFYLANLLAGQLVGIRLADHATAQLRFGPVHLGAITQLHTTAAHPKRKPLFVPVT